MVQQHRMSLQYDVWQKILVLALDLHETSSSDRKYDRNYKSNPGFGLSNIELTCRLFRDVGEPQKYFQKNSSLG